MATTRALLLLGRDHPTYGHAHVEARGGSAGAISVGSDPTSPSHAAKGEPETCPNEDALLLLNDGRRVLLAVTDAHYGAESGHRILELLAASLEGDGIPIGVEALLVRLRDLRLPPDAPPAQPDSETTLLVASLDREAGRGAVLSFGDSSLTWVGPNGEDRINAKTRHFVTLARPRSLLPGFGRAGEFRVESGGLLLAFTDGIDECHYGAPRTSVRARHRVGLFHETGPHPAVYAQRLVDLALRGVGGHPGGQDNVALVVART